MASSVFAYTPQEVVNFFVQYKPFKIYDAKDSMVKVCTTYVDALFYDAKLKDYYVYEGEGTTSVVSVVFDVGKLKTGVLENAPTYLKDEILKIKGQLSLYWIVDIDRKSVEVRNMLASACILFYADMLSSQ
jgi:hypothetical protein